MYDLRFYLLFFILLNVCTSQYSSIFSYFTRDSPKEVYDYIGESLGYVDSNLFKDNLTDALKQSLFHHVICQDQAVHAVIKSISSWEFQQRSGLFRALLLAFTGPTGVGKSETAHQVAEALLAKRTPEGRPKGLLVIHGEDYVTSTSRESGSSSQSRIDKFKQELVTRIATYIKACQGKSIIMIDEIQKIAPGVLEILVPAFDKHGALRIPGQPGPVDTTNCIFIFISDIAADAMFKLILTYQSRDGVPQEHLRREVKGALNEQWNRLKFGGMVDEVVPFMPLEEAHLKVILKHKLDKFALLHQGTYWKDLIVDNKIIRELVSSKYIDYKKHSIVSPITSSSDTSTESPSMWFASWARSIFNAGNNVEILSYEYV